MGGIAALIVAAGRGERAGTGAPKQYRPLAGRSILRRAVEAFERHPDISMVQVVIGASDHEDYQAATKGLDLLPTLAGGHSRQHSVLHGLQALTTKRPEFVLIHDAARPLVSRALIDRVIGALPDADAAVPLLPVSDTLKKQIDGKWTTVPRDGLNRAQTPQGFRFDAIVKAHREFAGRDVTDDMALAELAGLKIVGVAGEENNMKITTPDDFARAEALLGGGETRTGFGFDAHRFAAGDHIWLCGVKLPHDKSLEGHSDADVGLHALTDAILGTIGAGDIGQHFSPDDERWRGASSDKFLAHAAKLVSEAGGAIVHCDVTLICERPKIAPHREAMRARIAEILGLDVSRVSVKATTTEGMGFAGRGEGLAAQAIATIRI
ncbi:MAG TPA: bifunctional 2-C-methyl-D-erythritol 4-phosphate cytidylyltransferase/2-C-methyl-D-erythritol 2,4-cyclodiphosphate synthase [Rhizomicrobium sp.]|nr:bifunctional 2-C-methyl-D-erythritol 4-phosphate cytidylyltransferase/2-C-methyl-D-erythritol 2,4-cyclodiphosphate synthase [Rhizomicrobium sp.]